MTLDAYFARKFFWSVMLVSGVLGAVSSMLRTAGGGLEEARCAA